MLGKPIDSYVINQISVRQKTQGSGISTNRTPQQISALNSSTSWVKLASGASVDAKRLGEAQLPSSYVGTNLARNYVLFGGTSRLNGNKLSQKEEPFSRNGSYTIDDTVGGLEFGLTPMPGVESINIQHINNGSLRKATVVIKAYNKAQFDALDILYMRLGYTMLLEWGNSTYINNSGGYETMGPTLTETGFLDNSLPNLPSTEILKKISSLRASYNGNYDALYGRISNFNWKFNPDGSYSIELNILSLGEIFESLKINIPASSQEIKFSTDASLLLFETKPEASGSYLGQPEDIELQAPNDSSPTKDKLSTYLFNLKLSFTTQKVTAPEEIDFKINGTPIKIGSFVKPSPTITIPSSGSGTPATLNNNAAEIQSSKDIAYFFYSNGEEPMSVIPEDLGYYMRLGHLLEYIKRFIIPKVKNSGGKEFPIIELDTSQDNKMYYFPNQISLDPRVCVVNSKLRQITLFDTLSPWIGNGYANTMNIYLSFEQIHSSLESNIDEENRVNLYGFLSTICDSLNVALGGVNNLQPVIDEDTNTVKIIDQNYNPNPQSKDNLILYGYEGNNSTFVRSVSLKTAITPELISTIAVGATENGYSPSIENTMFAKWNKNIKNRFQPKIITPDPKTTPIDPVQNYINNFYAKGKLALGYKYDGSENPPEIDKDSIGNNISIATEFYKYAQSFIHSRNPEYGSPTQGFIPINLGITMNGISGIKIFNSLSVDTSFLPKNYPKALRFIAKAVNHKVSDQDWETTLETLVIPETYKENGGLILSFSDLDFYTNLQLLNGYGITSVVLDETTGNINLPSWLTERFAALRTPPSTATGPGLNLGGPGLEPLKNYACSHESHGDYNIYNFNAPGQTSGAGGIRTSTPGSSYTNLGAFKITENTAKQLLTVGMQSQRGYGGAICSAGTGQIWAAGKYQTIPCTLKSAVESLGLLDSLMNAETQEKIGDWLMLNQPGLGVYLKGGNNKGTVEDLEKAVQGLGQLFASLPIVFSKNGSKVGNVTTGAGNNAYYGGDGINPSTVEYSVKDSVQAIVKSRIQYSDRPSFVPTYFVP